MPRPGSASCGARHRGSPSTWVRVRVRVRVRVGVRAGVRGRVGVKVRVRVRVRGTGDVVLALDAGDGVALLAAVDEADLVRVSLGLGLGLAN